MKQSLVSVKQIKPMCSDIKSGINADGKQSMGDAYIVHLIHWGRDKWTPFRIFKRIFLNENVWIPIKISLKFVPKGPINNIPAMVQIMAWRRPGDKPLSEPMVVSLPTQICVARPQWVNAYICGLRQSSRIWILKCRYELLYTLTGLSQSTGPLPATAGPWPSTIWICFIQCFYFIVHNVMADHTLVLAKQVTVIIVHNKTGWMLENNSLYVNSVQQCVHQYFSHMEQCWYPCNALKD